MRRKIIGRILGVLSTLSLIPRLAAAQILFTIGGPGLDYGKAVTVDDKGNTYLAPYFQNTVDYDPGSVVSNLTASSFVDIAFAKYDAGGNLVWVRHFRNTNATPAQADIPHGIVLDAATNIYLTGYFSGTLDFDPGPAQALRTSFGAYDTWIASYDPDGNFRWAQTFGNTNAGNASEERNYDIAVEASGYSYSAGYFEGALNVASLVSAGGQDGVVAKYDPSGNLVWAFSLGATTNDQAQAVALDGLGHLYIIGSFRGTVDFDPTPGVSNLTSVGAGTDIFVTRYTTNALLDWAFRIGGNGFEQGAPGGLSVDGDGNIFFTGRFQQTVDFDPGPGVSNLVSVGSDDFFIASYTASGSLRWNLGVGGNGLDGGHRVRLDPQTNVYACGWFTGNADFNPGPDVYLLSATSTNGGSDAFVAKYDPTGQFLWASALHPGLGNTNFGIAAGMWVDNRGRAYVTGQFFSDSSLVAGGQTFVLTNAGVSDCFLVRLDSSGALAGAEIDELEATDSNASFRVLSAAGHDYTVMVSSNLTTWTTGATYSASGFLRITNTPADAVKFYHVYSDF